MVERVRAWVDSRAGCGVVVGMFQVYKGMKCKQLARKIRNMRSLAG